MIWCHSTLNSNISSVCILLSLMKNAVIPRRNTRYLQCRTSLFITLNRVMHCSYNYRVLHGTDGHFWLDIVLAPGSLTHAKEGSKNVFNIASGILPIGFRRVNKHLYRMKTHTCQSDRRTKACNYLSLLLYADSNFYNSKFRVDRKCHNVTTNHHTMHVQ